MKRLYIVIPILLLIAFGSCKKVSGPANGNSVQVNNNLDSTVFLTATVNGQVWKTDSAVGYLIKSSANDSLVNGLMINATKGTGDSAKTINFYITTYTGPGTYPINPPYNTATYYQGTTRYFATSGQVVLTLFQIATAVDTGYALLGTFNFIADGDTVTNGSFNVALP